MLFIPWVPGLKLSTWMCKGPKVAKCLVQQRKKRGGQRDGKLKREHGVVRPGTGQRPGRQGLLMAMRPLCLEQRGCGQF